MTTTAPRRRIDDLPRGPGGRCRSPTQAIREVVLSEPRGPGGRCRSPTAALVLSANTFSLDVIAPGPVVSTGEGAIDLPVDVPAGLDGQVSVRVSKRIGDTRVDVFEYEMAASTDPTEPHFADIAFTTAIDPGQYQIRCAGLFVDPSQTDLRGAWIMSIFAVPEPSAALLVLFTSAWTRLRSGRRVAAESGGFLAVRLSRTA